MSNLLPFMYVEQIYTNCLAEASYYVESNGEAIIIDPIRETAPYIKKANDRGAKIKYIFETHFHADFISGHVDLSKATGAPIVYGPLAETNYEIISAKDNQIFTIGELTLKVLHTPGHTPESTCYLLLDKQQQPYCVFSGDTLFVGDVGRPDLLDGKMTKEALAEMMYNSLNTKIKILPDHVIVYPAHGPGSACGKNIGKETFSTIAEQKKSNYALADVSKAAFIEMLTTGLSAPPAYFFEDARINRMGYLALDQIIEKGLKELTVEAVKQAMNDNITIIDTRIPDVFEKGFLPHAINIGLNGQYAIWAATLLDLHQPIILVTEKGKEEESITRLARVGFDTIIGVLQGGFEAWQLSGANVETIRSIQPNEMSSLASTYQILDVRRQGEYDNGHLSAAHLLSLETLQSNAAILDKEQAYLIHCAGGYRSMIAASILKQHGINNVVNVYGGYAKIKEDAAELVA
jgi:hydroxyacylglutathione hydrolase